MQGEGQGRKGKRRGRNKGKGMRNENTRREISVRGRRTNERKGRKIKIRR